MTAQRAALETFGLDHQLIKLAEECAELTQAALKLRLYGPDPKRQANLLEEIADVEIMLEQMRLHFGDGAVDAQRSRKLTRLEERLKVPTQPFRAPRVAPGPKPKGKAKKGGRGSAVTVDGIPYASQAAAGRALKISSSVLSVGLREGRGCFVWRGKVVKEAHGAK